MGEVVRLQKQEKDWRAWLEDFLLQKEIEGVSGRTLRDYHYHVERFFSGIENFCESEIKRRLHEYFTRNIAPATFNIRRAYLKAFFSYLVEQGVISQNPITFKRRKDESKARAIPQKVLKKLLELPDKSTYTGLRDYVLILFTLDTGIRPKEALSLLPEHFNLEAREVTVPGGIAKTKATRTLPLSPLTVQWLKKLFKVRPPEWKGAPVFCSQDGKQLLEASWSHRLASYSKRLGHKVAPYDLRHSFALHSLRNGMDPFVLQRILGHTNLTMTKRYLALTQEDLQKEHEKTSPVNIFKAKRMRKIKK